MSSSASYVKRLFFDKAFSVTNAALIRVPGTGSSECTLYSSKPKAEAPVYVEGISGCIECHKQHQPVCVFHVCVFLLLLLHY
ncbi:hypothetical protein UY3_14728 [Chelonia mydas]|uniref:Uncharacterized protein n=1 Tax=Chelonia mydas TaxID=8469 RepID=M7B7P5_CHEMY|nr:hypothetical protein UY3_14728 [Chelonia mydas]